MKTPTDTLSWKRLLWQRSWRRPAVRRVFYEILGLILLRRKGMQILNCGYRDAGLPAIPLAGELEAERYGFQLYDRLAAAVPLAGADVLEVGCGRGGGARYLADRFGPLSYSATDSCLLFTVSNRLRARPGGPHFRLARSDTLPFPPCSFDIAIAVEAIHPLPDRDAFLAEMARVLRPGGRLLVADFFYARESSPNALTAFRAAIGRSWFKVDLEEDWTRQALAALESDSPRRLAEIRRLPRIFRKPALSFACTAESPLYRQLLEGRAHYAHFELSRRRTSAGC